MTRFGSILCVSILLASAAWAQRPMSVPQLEQFVKSSIEQKQKDKEVADILKNVRMTQKLEMRVVENLQGMGAGPRTLDALKVLSAASASLSVAPSVAIASPVAPPPPPAPSAAEQKKILAQVTQNALEYTKGLPNFTCTQVTRRRVDTSGRDNWRLVDTIQEQLSFVDGKEDYKVVLVNNLPVTNVGHNQLGGATSSGEFGSQLREIFKPETQTDFVWHRWATLRGHRMHVLSYRVKQATSEFSIDDQTSGRRIVAGYHGEIFADAESNMVMRLDLEADGLEDFPIRRVHVVLDYDYTQISGQNYVLPLRASVDSASSNYATRNEVEFRRYNKFSADAAISFDEPDPIPQDQLEEKK